MTNQTKKEFLFLLNETQLKINITRQILNIGMNTRTYRPSAILISIRFDAPLIFDKFFVLKMMNLYTFFFSSIKNLLNIRHIRNRQDSWNTSPVTISAWSDSDLFFFSISSPKSCHQEQFRVKSTLESNHVEISITHRITRKNMSYLSH